MIATIIILAAVAVAVVVLLLALPTVGPGNGSLQRRFGPEYERAVTRHDGDVKAARKDLSERVRRHGRLRVRALSAGEREQYELKWARVQERFVDSPVSAAAEADHLLTQLVHDRGFPSDAYDDQVAALSVHHPRQVESYRRLHALAARADAGGTGTEEMREALLRGRDLFRELVAAGPQDSAEHRAGPRRMRIRRSGHPERQDAATKGGA
ncbi:hypothetical protein [Streptomyces johnsoniae]|uniref:Secreted protein n=1 Tax=Streptomyces johnsoniae TaxID=3075532 RepID=A0ABU2SGK3_9ACTN|nr:hypothetical protein [Streptomyces sp. DSM 41886]MDT0447215.1 hypothetical protein [Streptomyces sp. DSM 41886]